MKILLTVTALLLSHPHNQSPQHPEADHHRHLQPESVYNLDFFFSQFNPKQDYSKIITDLSKIYPSTSFDHVFARFIAHPFFDRSYAVLISRNNKQYHIYTYDFLEKNDYLPPSRRRAKAETEDKSPKNTLPLKSQTCQLPINTELGEILYLLWAETLASTRYDYTHPITAVSDGGVITGSRLHAIYQFSFWHPKNYLRVGYVNTPPDDSVLGRLVSVGNAIKSACNNPTEKNLTNIRNDAKQLMDEFKKENDRIRN